MRTFADFLPSAKFWRFPAAFFIVSWVWQCANIIVSFHTILGTIALVLFGIALLCLTALLIVDSFPSSSRELLLGNTLVISITLSSALSVVLCASSRASLDGDGAYRFSCLCLISLATPVVLRKLIKSVNQYIVVGSMIIGVIAVAHSCFVQRSTSHAAHVAVCVLYTLCLSTFDDSGSNREQQPADETQSMPVGTQKDQGAPIIGLIANAAHDLKTPLVSFMVGIDNALETLFNVKQICDLSDCKCASNQSILHLLSSVELCIGNCKRTNQFMLMVINRMMDSAKSARGLKLSPKYETISLLDTIKLPLECVRNLKSDVPIVLEKIPDEICRYIITDKQWLQENLLALLTNAVKYSNGGTVVLRVLLECFKGSSKSSHQYIRFEVEDEGIGMTNEASESLFNPFQQNQRLAGGTGLGLFSLSKRTEALKGQCGVQKRSDEKQGSLFWFTIQYRPDESHLSSGSSRGENLGDLQSMLESPDRDSTSDNDHFEGLSKYSEQPQSLYEINRMSSNSTSLPTLSSISLPGESETTAVAPFDGSLDIVSSMSDDKTGLKRPRVLLVDDTTSILKMTTMMLKMHDFDVTAAMNGAAALDIVEESCKKVAHLQQSLEVPFDVVLMDLQMPIMDGIEATKRLRRWEMEGITSRGVVVNQQKRLKIIGLSANSDDEVLEETKKAGFDGFIPKPFNVKSLRPFLD